MNVVPLIAALAVAGICKVIYHSYQNPRMKICGDSMSPTYVDGEIVTGKRFSRGMRVYPGDVVAARSPENTRVIKRVIKTDYANHEHLIWIEGDNASVSYDSRSYGWIPLSSVIAIDPKKREKRREIRSWETMM